MEITIFVDKINEQINIHVETGVKYVFPPLGRFNKSIRFPKAKTKALQVECVFKSISEAFDEMSRVARAWASEERLYDKTCMKCGSFWPSCSARYCQTCGEYL